MNQLLYRPARKRGRPKKRTGISVNSYKRVILLGIFSLMIVLLFSGSGLIFANNGDAINRKNVVLPQNEVINETYITSGNTITISGTINGDVYLAGGNILVDGVINGDLLAAGGLVTIAGTVTQDVRVIGGQVNISGNIGRNITIVGGSAVVANHAQIGEGLVGAVGSLNIFAPLQSLNVAAGQLTINTAIQGDVNAGVGELQLAPTASISGSLTYWSDQQANIQPGATVSGQIVHNQPQRDGLDGKGAAAITSAALMIKGIHLLTYLLLGLLFIFLFPIHTERVVGTILQRLWSSLGIGFLALLLTPVVILILFFTIIGIPLAFVLLFITIVTFYMAPIWGIIALGEQTMRLFSRRLARHWVYIIGLLVYAVLGFIPILGWIVMFILMLMGLGALLIQKRAYYTEMKETKLL